LPLSASAVNERRELVAISENDNYLQVLVGRAINASLRRNSSFAWPAFVDASKASSRLALIIKVGGFDYS